MSEEYNSETKSEKYNSETKSEEYNSETKSDVFKQHLRELNGSEQLEHYYLYALKQIGEGVGSPEILSKALENGIDYWCSELEVAEGAELEGAKKQMEMCVRGGRNGIEGKMWFCSHKITELYELAIFYKQINPESDHPLGKEASIRFTQMAQNWMELLSQISSDQPEAPEL